MFEVITFAVAMVAMLLHFIAKKTDTQIDDKAAEIVDKVQEYLPLAKPLFPAAKPAPAPAGDATKPTARRTIGF